MSHRRGAKTDKPGVTIKLVQERRYHPEPSEDWTAPRQRATDKRCQNRTPVPTGIVRIGSLFAIEVAEDKSFLSHDPIINDQNSRDRSQTAGITNQPGEDVTGRIGEQPPRLHQNADDAGD